MTEAERCRKLIAWFYELPTYNMGSGLTIVSIPQGWMDAKDVDLIKKALKQLEGKEC